jgi:hypothetical protein
LWGWAGEPAHPSAALEDEDEDEDGDPDQDRADEHPRQPSPRREAGTGVRHAGADVDTPVADAGLSEHVHHDHDGGSDK